MLTDCLVLRSLEDKGQDGHHIQVSFLFMARQTIADVISAYFSISRIFEEEYFIHVLFSGFLFLQLERGFNFFYCNFFQFWT